MKQNNLTADSVEHAFQVSGEEVHVILPKMPGASVREQAINAYVFAGLSALLGTGNRTFTDDAARAVCRQYSCYDKNNHSKSLLGLKGKAHGSKSQGWTLTTPGEKFAAALIRDLAQASVK